MLASISLQTGFWIFIVKRLFIKSVSLQLFLYILKKKIIFQPWGSTKHNSISSKSSSRTSAVCWVTQDASAQLDDRGKARTDGVYRRIPGAQETCRVLWWWPRGAKYGTSSGTPQILKRERFSEVKNYGRGFCFSIWFACFFFCVPQFSSSFLQYKWYFF